MYLPRKLMFVATLLSLLLAIGPGWNCGGFPVPELPDKVVGHCVYKNAFSGFEECKDYVGGWEVQEAVDNCKGSNGKMTLEKKCSIPDNKRFGDCIFIKDKAKEKYERVELPGEDSSKCGSMKRGCEFFGGGSFVPTTICGAVKDDGPSKTLPIFRPPIRICKAPKEGEPPGKSEDGQVCTWSAIGGATEEGRNFEDYASCERVRTQRPYYPVPPADTAGEKDKRLDDPAYVKENNWVKKQIRAAACVCCHSTSAPDGPSNWFLESGPSWIKSMAPRGLAMGAGWINTEGFGTYPADQNNGFTRVSKKNVGFSAFPSTDDARMRKFFENELKLRGKTREDFKNEKYAAGPLDAQRFYKPKDCESKQQKIDSDGTLHWIGGAARYIYILEQGSFSPGVPPNLDTPEGTIWRLDVHWKDGTPIESGTIKIGDIPKGAMQKFPKDGKPAKLVSGKKYYLYVLKDIANPLTRCFLVAP